MEMADYRLSREALRDVKSIMDYTAREFGRTQADRYRAELHAAALTIVAFPRLGRPYRTSTGEFYRRHDCGRHGLFYSETDGGIVIVRILHLMMNLDDHLR
ncbi:MAG TPA: type II toxin-antitoxin system RelE/ParE family toxin [Aurantimonas coralicida]|uniref:Toxin n=2 Tax=root TaxID=1 RepID=A0A9C9NL64_9HYPH|nr:type II toxin-antitoxin system RelE/ParE family toxin [Aurantimonas coralicida]HEU03355.1 type II toxin-antitoxin system RelE/ParE family toxin [Aurantimonas coralicida]